MREILFRRILSLVALATLAFCGCATATRTDNEGLPSTETRPFDPATKPMRLTVKGNRIFDARGEPVWLYGVNIASLEWRESEPHISNAVNHAIAEWRANIIRLPLSQDRWFGKTTNQTDGGVAYRNLVDSLVDLCASRRVYINLDLHWSSCGIWANEGGRPGQHVMPDQHSVLFWRDVARRYKNHPNVLFCLYNEPHDVSWPVWRNGGTVTDVPNREGEPRLTYEAVGMQTLYDVVRATGAKNVVAVSGLDWGFDLSGVMKGYALEGRNIIYETHPYEFKHDWDKAFVPLTDTYVVYLGEWGGGAQQLDYGRRVMDYVRRYNLHWTAWDFHPQAGPTLIRNWSFEPTVFGQFVKDLLADAATEREQKETN